MTSVTAKASPQVMSYRPATGAVAAVPLAVAAAVALAVALHAPLLTAVVGLIAFGIIHNFFELRYVLGRFDGILTGQLLGLLLAGITAISLLRLGNFGEVSLRGEILVGFGLLALVLLRARRLRPVVAGIGLLMTVGAVAVSLRFPLYHFVVLAHLHNIVPLIFLWEWARELPAGAPRQSFRAVQIAWVLVIPALLLIGTFDSSLAGIPATLSGISVDPSALTSSVTPPAWRDGVLPVRFLTAFAFLQTMHYAVWCWFLPRYARSAVDQFEAKVPVAKLVPRRRFLAIAGITAAFFAVLFFTDYATGRSLYGAVATYHAYLEFPILLALLLRMGTSPDGATTVAQVVHQ